MSARYSVVQYLPDPATAERINIGVLVWDRNDLRSRFVSDWTRVRAFARADVSFLQGFAREIRQLGSHRSAQKAASDYRQPSEVAAKLVRWKHSIQLTEPRGSTLGVEELLSRIAGAQLTDNKPSHDSAELLPVKLLARGRTEAAKLARRAVESVVEGLTHNAKEWVKKDWTLKGAMDEHRFDVVVANGVNYGAVRAISFEIKETERLKTEVDATAWTVNDVRLKYRELPIGVFVLPPPASTTTFANAKKVFDQLGADVLTEAVVRRWANKVTRDLPHVPDIPGIR